MLEKNIFDSIFHLHGIENFDLLGTSHITIRDSENSVTNFTTMKRGKEKLSENCCVD